MFGSASILQRIVYGRQHKKFKTSLHKCEEYLEQGNQEEIELLLFTRQIEPKNSWDYNSLVKWCYHTLNECRVNDHYEQDPVEQVKRFTSNQYRIQLVNHMIINHGIDPNLTNYQGNTLSMLAILHGFPDITEAMIVHPDLNPNLQNANGDTLPMLAAERNNEEIVLLILDNFNVNLNIQNREGKTLPMLIVEHHLEFALHQILNGEKFKFRLYIRDNMQQWSIDQYLLYYNYYELFSQLVKRLKQKDIPPDFLLNHGPELFNLIREAPLTDEQSEYLREAFEYLGELGMFLNLSSLDIVSLSNQNVVDFFGYKMIHSFTPGMVNRLHKLSTCLPDHEFDQIMNSECAICRCDFQEEMEKMLISDIFKGAANCNCYFHRNCAMHLATTIQNSIQDKPPIDYKLPKCPGCQSKMTPSFIWFCFQEMGIWNRGFLNSTESLVRRLNNMISEFLISKNGAVVYCPSNSCDGFVLMHPEHEEMRPCPKCYRRQLFRGRDVDKISKLESKEVKSLLANNHKIRPCPHCGKLIERISGCNSMKCGFCKNDFHWNRGKKDIDHDTRRGRQNYTPDYEAHF